MIEYIPRFFDNPKVVQVPSAWGKIPTILKSIITDFNIKSDIALEFGVERGYSTTAISNYFDKVIGVDPFYEIRTFYYEDIKQLLKPWANIELFKSKFEDYIPNEHRRFDLIHIDIIHEYSPTYNCGDWSVQHSDVVIFHDTISFPAMFTVCEDLAKRYNLEFYNYPLYNGLGILVRK